MRSRVNRKNASRVSAMIPQACRLPGDGRHRLKEYSQTQGLLAQPAWRLRAAASAAVPQFPIASSYISSGTCRASRLTTDSIPKMGH